MVSRWMAEKLLKQKKHRQRTRRAYLAHKKFSYDPTSLAAISSRGSKKLDFMAPVPNTVPAKTAEVKPNAKPMNVLVKDWQDLRLQGFTQYHRIVIWTYTKYSLELFFSGQDFIFFEEDLAKGIQRRSAVYRGRDSAYRALSSPRGILWEKTIDITETT